MQTESKVYIMKYMERSSDRPEHMPSFQKAVHEDPILKKSLDEHNSAAQFSNMLPFMGVGLSRVGIIGTVQLESKIEVYKRRVWWIEAKHNRDHKRLKDNLRDQMES